MDVNQEDNGFIPFVCNSCHQEIEASPDMMGQTVECPACGAKIKVPDAPKPASDQGPSEAQLNAMKSRTIRIELPDL